MKEKSLERLNYEITSAALRYGLNLKPQCFDPRKIVCDVAKITYSQYDTRMEKIQTWGIFELFKLVQTFDNQFAEYIRERFPLK